MIFVSRNDPCVSLWFCKRLVAEPRVWTQRSQGKILETFVDLDFMHTNGVGTVLPQDSLSLLLLLGRADADPQDEAAGSHQRFEFPGPLRSENAADQGTDAAPGRPACGGRREGQRQRSSRGDDPKRRSRSADVGEAPATSAVVVATSSCAI